MHNFYSNAAVALTTAEVVVVSVVILHELKNYASASVFFFVICFRVCLFVFPIALAKTKTGKREKNFKQIVVAATYFAAFFNFITYESKPLPIPFKTSMLEALKTFGSE